MMVRARGKKLRVQAQYLDRSLLCLVTSKHVKSEIMPISVSDVDACKSWDHAQGDSIGRLGPGII
jgi:hypothetical protein